MVEINPPHVSDLASLLVHSHKLLTGVSCGITVDFFFLLVSLLYASENSTELHSFPSSSLVDDGWHSFVSLPNLPAWPCLPAGS